MLDQRRILVGAGAVDQRHRRLDAGVASNPHRAFLAHHRDDQARPAQRFAELAEQQVPAVGGSRGRREAGRELAVAAMALGSAAEAHRGDRRAALADDVGAGLGGADRGERRGDGNGKLRTHRHQRLDRGVADGDAIDEIDVGQQRRACEHHRGDFRLVGGERGDDLHRRVAAHRQRLGHGEPDLR